MHMSLNNMQSQTCRALFELLTVQQRLTEMPYHFQGTANDATEDIAVCESRVCLWQLHKVCQRVVLQYLHFVESLKAVRLQCAGYDSCDTEFFNLVRIT